MGDQVSGYTLVGSALTALRPPIVVVDGSDVMIFESASDAERELEPIDVASGAYRLFDVDGRVLDAAVVTSPRRRRASLETRQLVTVTIAAPEQFAVGPLVDVLQRYAIAAGVPPVTARSADVFSLVEAIQARERRA